MTMLHFFQTGPVAELGDGIFILDLARIRGGKPAVLRRIPTETAGVYAWYRGFAMPSPETSTPEEYARALIQAATAPHCATREARIPPSLRLLLQPYQAISSKKQRAIASYCESLAFRRMVTQILDMSLLFQQPLYVGKATNLSQRIEQHLGPRSKLRARFDDAQISMDSTKLLFVTFDDSILGSLPSISLADIEDTDLYEDLSSTRAEAELPLELVMEEILSRLFLPSFTLRYG